jgi:hypothetical protein
MIVTYVRLCDPERKRRTYLLIGASLLYFNTSSAIMAATTAMRATVSPTITRSPSPLASTLIDLKAPPQKNGGGNVIVEPFYTYNIILIILYVYHAHLF